MILSDHITVVLGPPGSGKTTYVNEHKSYGDLVWDFDAVAQAITGLPLYTCPRGPHAFVLAMREAFIQKAIHDRFAANRIWIIATQRDAVLSQIECMGAAIVSMQTEKEVCLERVSQRSAEVKQAVNQWFEN